MRQSRVRILNSYFQILNSSERDVVVGERFGNVGTGGADRCAGHALFAAARVTAAAATAASAAEQDDAVAAHLGGLALDAFLVGVFVGLQPALNVDLLAFDEVFRKRLGLLAPQVDVVPLGAFLALAAFVVPHFGGRDA